MTLTGDDLDMAWLVVFGHRRPSHLFTALCLFFDLGHAEQYGNCTMVSNER